MVVYIDLKFIGETNHKMLVSRYPDIEFIDDKDRCDELEVIVSYSSNLVIGSDLSNYPLLKWIQFFSAGYDGVDFKAMKELNIVFSNAQNIFSKSIAEDVFTKILYFNRNIKHDIDSMNDKVWKPIPNNPELTNSNVLILGVGSIGKELAKRFKAFEMTVVGYRKNPVQEDNFDKIITSGSELEEALKIADYAILALPLNKHTEYMFDRSKFDLMKKSSLFINVARGKVVKQDDLYNALKNKQIRGAGLDVTDPEPLPSDHPLWDLDNVFITPHNASSSEYMKERLVKLLIMNLDLYIANKPIQYKIK